MKNISLLILVFLSTFASAQVDPDIFDQNWFLYEIYDSDLQEILVMVDGYTVYGEPYAISPYVILDQSLNFQGVGICDTFEGSLEQHPSENYFRTIETTVIDITCEIPSMDEVRIIGPFGYVDPDPTFYTIVNPEITDDSDGFQTLTYITQPFVYYTYRNTPILSVNEFKKSMFSLYPNPTTGMLHFYNQNVTPELVSIFSATGAKVLELMVISSSNSLDISSLRDGVYFVEITSDQGKEIHKIVKN